MYSKKWGAYRFNLENFFMPAATIVRFSTHHDPPLLVDVRAGEDVDEQLVELVAGVGVGVVGRLVDEHGELFLGLLHDEAGGVLLAA